MCKRKSTGGKRNERRQTGKEGRTWKYFPDFLIKLSNEKMLILEVKGIESDQDKIKFAALTDWVKAVNGTKRFGEWACDVSYSPADIDGIIAKYI